MEITKSFVSKYNEGEELWGYASVGRGCRSCSPCTIIRISFNNTINKFKYLVEYVDGSRTWESEEDLIDKWEYERIKQGAER